MAEKLDLDALAKHAAFLRHKAELDKGTAEEIDDTYEADAPADIQAGLEFAAETAAKSADAIGSLIARLRELEAAASTSAENKRDAERWRAFEKALRTRIPGPGHGRRIKVVEISPMYGDETDVPDIKEIIDAAIAASKKGGA